MTLVPTKQVLGFLHPYNALCVTLGRSKLGRELVLLCSVRRVILVHIKLVLDHSIPLTAFCVTLEHIRQALEYLPLYPAPCAMQGHTRLGQVSTVQYRAISAIQGHSKQALACQAPYLVYFATLELIKLGPE